MNDSEIDEITITLMLTRAQARTLATALDQLAPAMRALAGHDADEAMVLSSWIYASRQALKESGYEP